MPILLPALLALLLTTRPPDEPAPGAVVLNEILFHPPEAALEYVELYNRSDRSVALAGLSLADARGRQSGLPPDAGLLPPGAFAVLVRDSAIFATRFPGVPFVTVRDWPALNDGGDAVVLRYGPVLLDSLAYAASWGVPGVSIERIDPEAPSDRLNFAAATAPGGGTPGRENSRHAPDRTPPALRFVEEAAPRALFLLFDEGLSPASLSPPRFRLDDGLTPESLVTTGHSAGEVELWFRSELSGSRLHVEGVRDRSGNAAPPVAAPIAYRPGPGELLLNEILAEPLADPADGRADQPEYVELLNASARLLTLRGGFWTDEPDERGRADTLRWPEGPDALRPGACAAVYAAGPEGGAGLLPAAFPEASAEAGAVLIPVPRGSFGLPAAGGTIRLHRTDGRLLDSVRYEAAWHHPDLAQTRGVSLERIATDVPALAGERWTSSAHPSGGTPGMANSIRAPEPPGSAGYGLVLTPGLISPDGDGRDDVVLLTYSLRARAPTIRVRVFDADGRPAATLAEASLSGPQGALLWNGRGDGDRPLRIGPYVVLLEAVDASGEVERYRQVIVLARLLR